MSLSKNMACWVVTEGMAGTENQCLGIAEALGLDATIKRIALRQPWKTLSPFIGFERSHSFEPSLAPPWPDLLIAGGRKGIATARYIKKASGGKTFTVFVQDPRINPLNFDLVVAPEHDPVRGPNVVVTAASPNRITPEKLTEAKARFPQFGSLKSPRVAVLIGGDSKAHTLTPTIMETLARQLKGLNAGLMITTSRRTGDRNKALLESALQGSNTYIWDGTGENPYFALLAWADFILVTADSVSMLSDAGTTGKPVYIVPLAGGSPRLNRFHQNLVNRGIARFFDGKLESWTYDPLRDAQKAADEIKKRLKL
jgi:mitochondrial fission protein ELM1